MLQQNIYKFFFKIPKKLNILKTYKFLIYLNVNFKKSLSTVNLFIVFKYSKHNLYVNFLLSSLFLKKKNIYSFIQRDFLRYFGIKKKWYTKFKFFFYYFIRNLIFNIKLNYFLIIKNIIFDYLQFCEIFFLKKFKLKPLLILIINTTFFGLFKTKRKRRLKRKITRKLALL